MKRTLPVALALLLLLSGCAARRRRIPVAPALRVGAVEEGIASWYGYPYHGRMAAGGEIYDMEKLTAAHRTLPFGTRVRVRDLDNGRAVVVRINDRGPFVDGRIIDLSRAAARSIRMLGPGTARVRLRVLALPAAEPPGYFAVQVGAFRERANADRTRLDMQRRYGEARLLRHDGNPPLWRVVVGHAATLDDAAALAARIRPLAGAAFVVRVDASESNL